MKNHCSNCLRVTSENEELRRWVNDTEGKTCEAVSSAKQLQVKVNSLTGKRDALATKCKELPLELQCKPELAEELRSLRARVVELVNASMTKA